MDFAFASEEAKGMAAPPIPEDPPAEKVESQEEDDESRIELLQWYLKMALEGEDDPKIKK